MLKFFRKEEKVMTDSKGCEINKTCKTNDSRRPGFSLCIPDLLERRKPMKKSRGEGKRCKAVIELGEIVASALSPCKSQRYRLFCMLMKIEMLGGAEELGKIIDLPQKMH